MRQRTHALWLLLAVACTQDEPARDPIPAGEPAPMVIDAATLRANREAIVLVDMQSTAQLYEQGHIAGAIHATIGDFRTDAKYLKPVGELEDVLGALGIREDSWVVAYDEKDGRNATWLWYTLDQLGHVKVSLLDGNLREFRGELETGSGPDPEPAVYVARRQPTDVVDLDWVLEHEGEVLLLDTRPEAQFTGEKPKKNMKAGHIPGSVHLHRSALLREDGSFLDVEQALELPSIRTLPRDKPIVVYCNTYHDGAHMHFQLARLGFDNLKAWDGGLVEYMARDDLPLETGPGGGR